MDQRDPLYNKFMLGSDAYPNVCTYVDLIAHLAIIYYIKIV